jgi:hypothetical protein
VKPYAVVHRKEMLVTVQNGFNEALIFAVNKNGERWKYATVTELTSIEV